jgi:hypothetical protein
MTTEQLHEELRQCGFHKIGTGGGCDALVKSLIGRRDIEVMLTAFEDATVPEADDQVHIAIRFEGDTEAWFILSPEQTLDFAKSLTTNETISKGTK